MNEQFYYRRPQFPAQINWSHPLTKNLVACWMLNEGGGMQAFDSTPYKQHLTAVLTKPRWSGRYFDGADNLRKAVSDWRSGDHIGTVLTWVKCTDVTTFRVIFGSYDEAVGNKLLECGIKQTDGVPYIIQQNADVSDYIYGSTNVADGNVHLIAYQSSGTAISIIVDNTTQGLTVGGGANNGDWIADTPDRDNIIIGCRKANTTSYYFVGIIGSVLYFNVLLTQPQIKDYYLHPYDMFLR